MNQFKEPLTLSLSPEYRGEGKRGRPDIAAMTGYEGGFERGTRDAPIVFLNRIRAISPVPREFCTTLTVTSVLD